MAPAGVVIIWILITWVPPIAESLTLKMTRRDLIDEALFPKNLSDYERNRIFADLTYFRVKSQHLQHVGPDTVRPEIRQFPAQIFAVPFLVGSENRGGFLLIDTGSDLTWVQCHGCRDCPYLAAIRYDRTTSNSYIPIPYTSAACGTGYNEGPECAFTIKYVSGTIYGIKGIETFTFPSTDPFGFRTELTFGCILEMGALKKMGAELGRNNVIAGLLALGYSPDSFMGRTAVATQLKFSYCFATWQRIFQRVEPHLTFGPDVPPIPPDALTIQMNVHGYYLNLLGLSIGSTRLPINPDVFRVKPNGEGGVHIDSGSGLSVLPHEVFETVRQGYMWKLAELGFFSIPPGQPPGHGPEGHYKLCYLDTFPPGEAVSWLPTMTWHFEGADLVVTFFNVFQKFRKNAASPVIVCMGIIDGGVYTKAPTLFGAMQQADHRFWYDLRRGTLSFVPTFCNN